MSRTYRDSWASAHIIHRYPRGHKKALVEGVRARAVPPHAWDDKRINRECSRIWTVAEKMAQRGFDKASVIKMLKARFQMTHKDASYVAGFVGKWHY